jgi:ankyrin repeat protein
VAELLVGRGAAVDRDNSGCTPLWAAAKNDHEAAAQVLLAAGADKTKKTPWGTAAEIAEKNGHSVLAQQPPLAL